MPIEDKITLDRAERKIVVQKGISIFNNLNINDKDIFFEEDKALGLVVEIWLSRDAIVD